MKQFILLTILSSFLTISTFAQSDAELDAYRKQFDIILYSADPISTKITRMKSEVPAAFFRIKGFYTLIKAVETRNPVFMDFVLSQPGVDINLTDPYTKENILRYLPRDNFQTIIPGTCTQTDTLANVRKQLLAYLLGKGAKLDQIDANGGNVMLTAVYNKDLDLLKHLYELNGKRFIQQPENNLLYYSCYIGCIDITKWLVENGMDVNMPNKYEGSAIGAASRRPEIIQYLISKGANVNASNAAGWTPLMYAVEYNNVASVQLLLDAGAKLDPKTNRGWDVFQVAKEYKSKDVVKLLKNAEKNAGK